MFQILVLLLFIKAHFAQKLLQANIYIRQGVRNQYYGLWNPNNRTDLQQLTPGGIRQMYILGEILKNQYLIKHKLIEQQKQFYIRSVDQKRTLMSANTLAYSLFQNDQCNLIQDKRIFQNALPPNVQNKFIGEEGDQQALPKNYCPVPIFTIPQSQDQYLMGWHPIACPILQRLNDENMKSKEMKQVDKEWEPLFKIMRSKGLDVTNLKEAAEFSDDFVSSKLEGETIPDFDEDIQEALNYTYNIYYQLTEFNRYDQVRFQATPFIQNLLMQLDNWKNQKLLLFLVHDNHLLMVLNLLNLTTWECVHNYAKTKLNLFEQKDPNAQPKCQITSYPSFGSSAAFELWTIKNTLQESHIEDLYIKFKFNGIYYSICKENLISCPLSNFKSQISGLINYDYQDRCDLQKLQYDSEKSKIMIFSVMCFIISFLFLIVGINYKKELRNPSQNIAQNIELGIY